MAGSFSSSKQAMKGLIAVVAFYCGSGESAPFPMGLVTGVSCVPATKLAALLGSIPALENLSTQDT